MDSIHKSAMMRISTPEGQMYVNVMENDSGEPFHVQINVGKAGTSVAAWSYALASMISHALQNGSKLEAIITELSLITSQGSARSINSRCSSGPEGVWMALVRYRKLKFNELVEQLGDIDLEDDDEPSIASVRQ